MNSNPVKIIIIEDDNKQVELIKSVLPEYYTVENYKYGEAVDKIRPNSGITTVVVMNADDKNDRSLGIYKHFSIDPDECGLSHIPFVLCTQDQFSDKAFSFYDYGDPFFHEGEIDDMDFFNVVNEAVENAEDFECEQLIKAEEKPQPEKVFDAASPDKLMGKSFSVSTEDADSMRVVAYNNEAIVKAINQVAGQSAEKAKATKAAVAEIIKEKEKLSKIKSNIAKIHNIKDAAKVGILLSDDENVSQVNPNTRENTVNTKMQNAAMRGQNQRGYNSQGPVVYGTNTQYKANPLPRSRKPKILIVDSDPMTLKACELFLGDKYIFSTADSNMKAVDYFVRDYADIVIIEQYMPGIMGTTILKSIMMQPNGRGVRATMIVDENKSDVHKEKIANTQGVVAIISKPIVKKQLIQAINMCMGNMNM